MTTPTTPAEELRAAAERLREVAKVATPGPWEGEGGDDERPPSVWTAYEGSYVADNIPHPEDAEWIATLSPAIAEPLALWLDTHVQWAQDVQVVFFEPDTGEVIDIDAARWPGLAAALAFARAILAAAPTPSPTGNPGGDDHA